MEKQTQHVHILGICGTFMAGVAVLAKQMGWRVTGCDQNVYPPMSTFLAEQGIEIEQGFDADPTDINADVYVVGNVMKRGMPILEALLNQQCSMLSGPEWLYHHMLRSRHVIAVAGTHGKTTTTSMIAAILEAEGLAPGFLIGGIPLDFGLSARKGSGQYFVVEADEYDTAFFDKRSKFVHYRPRTVVLNNLEFDHADIFPDLAAIERQFHHLVRMVPSEGKIIQNVASDALQRVLAQGCWTPIETIATTDATWQAKLLEDDGSAFEVLYQGDVCATVEWSHLGQHNVENALAAIAATADVGVSPQSAAKSLAQFQGVKRRMELRGTVRNIAVYDDFAHHPTAIASTLQGMRRHLAGKGRVLAVLEPRSNTMRMGHHGEALRTSLEAADQVFIYEPPGLTWKLNEVLTNAAVPMTTFTDIDVLLDALCHDAKPHDHIVVMSNGGFGNIHNRLLQGLQENLETAE